MTKKFLGLIILIFSSSVFADQPETLLGVKVDSEGIEYQVSSGGCTNKTNFRMGIAESFPIQLTLVRVEYDFCEAYLPYGTSIKYKWEELGVRSQTKISINNKIETIHNVFPRD